LVGSEFQIRTSEGKYPSAGLVAGRKRIAAWRILDAQYFRTPQRRRRLFLIASDVRGGGQIPQKYYLSIQACQGILRRAEASGIALPEELKLVLLATVNQKPIAAGKKKIAYSLHPFVANKDSDKPHHGCDGTGFQKEQAYTLATMGVQKVAICPVS
jgi:site-specific DNA-cytosine methylase